MNIFNLSCRDRATLTFDITNSFVPITPGSAFQYSPCLPKLSNVSSTDRITLPIILIPGPIPILFPGSNVVIKGGKNKPIDFTINIVPNGYAPLGMGFVQNVKKGGGTPKVAFDIMADNFVIIDINLKGRTLKFRDLCIDSSANCEFEFYVLIMELNSGKLGVVDPGITHDNLGNIYSK